MTRRPQAAEIQNSPKPQSEEDNERHRVNAASYIAELSASLAEIARKHRLETLAFILEMAQLEAEDATTES